MRKITAIWILVALGMSSGIAVARAGDDVPEQQSSAVDFKNDLVPMFTRLGCNAGKCHGSAMGRGGFKLSLYGGSPKADFNQIVHHLGGRRINFTDPSSSLILMKPAELVEHGGGTLIEEDGPAARSLLRWIEQGAPYLEQRQLDRVVVTPSRLIASETGLETPLRVTAYFDDGLHRDVTHLTQFVAEDSNAITVDSVRATAKVERPGRHLLIARYSTEVVPVELIAPMTSRPIDLSLEVRRNYVDDEILKTLEELHLPVSTSIDDATFLRRITLDLTGRLPSLDADLTVAPLNREALVNDLLASEAFIAYYASKLSRLFRIQSKIDKNKVTTTPKAARNFHDWLAEQLRKGRGYDELARQVITATGDSETHGPATFFTLVEDARLQTELVTEIFMGSRMKCANCHNHPLDQWTQDDFHGLTAMFAKLTRQQVIQLNPIGRNIHPNTGEMALMKIPGGNFLPRETRDGRGELADWLTSPENPFFAKAIVNRLWKSLMGRGLVEPVDDFRSTNPATHPKLLELLAEDFADHGYDLRHTLRTIALSGTYARSSNPVDENESDDRFYSHALRKPLAPEVLSDAISDVLGISPQYGDEVPGTRAVALRDGAVASDALDILGRCDRSKTCEAAPPSIGPLAQKLHLMNGELLNGRIGAEGGRLKNLIHSDHTPSEIIDAFYQVALNRRPRPEELEFFSQWLDDARPSSEQMEPLEDFVWGLMTCEEFSVNH
ncbi:MAG: DUF1553 domain-containing protein [Planctomycetota bacterium]|nr:DUF1553 domain-containing protein [Planctomycetota bacterium]MEC8305238.1 DUF1553 domain-containing protein [Planctomycetota bacterium]